MAEPFASIPTVGIFISLDKGQQLLLEMACLQLSAMTQFTLGIFSFSPPPHHRAGGAVNSRPDKGPWRTLDTNMLRSEVGWGNLASSFSVSSNNTQ